MRAGAARPKSDSRRVRAKAAKPRAAAASPASSSAVTLKDIARAVGVSAQTVSCVVNNSGSVSQEVRARVSEAAEAMGYVPNNSARAMRTGRGHKLGLVISDMNNPFFPEIAQAVERAAAAAGYALLLVDAQGSAAEAEKRIASLKRHGVDGVIATEFYPGLGRLGLPAVVIGRTASRMDSVNADDAAGGALLAEHLLEKGHRRFGLVSGAPIGNVVARRGAFLRRIEGEGEIAWESGAPGDGKITPEIIAMLARTDMSAVVCSCDADAIAVLRALQALGRDVPGDVSVVGFDDIPLASVVSPALTTVRQPYAALGAEAVGLVMARIANPKRRVRNLKLDVSLVARDSVAVLPKGAPDSAAHRRLSVVAGVEA